MEVAVGTEGADAFTACAGFVSTADGDFQWAGAGGADTFTYSNGTEIRLSYFAETFGHNGNGVWGDQAGEFGVIVNASSAAISADAGNGLETVQAGRGRDTYGFTDVISGLRDYLLTGANDTFAGSNAGMIARGEGGSDTMTGGTAADTFFGGSGGDTLIGGRGVDNLRRRARQRQPLCRQCARYCFGVAAGGALDTIFASISYTISINVERMYLTGAANINGTGVNGQNDIMYGNTGNNILDG